MATWAPAGMGALAPRKCCKVFCALVVSYRKRPVDELFINYFHNMSSASASFAPDPRGSIPRPR